MSHSGRPGMAGKRSATQDKLAAVSSQRGQP